MTLKTRNLPIITAFVVLNYILFAIVNGLPWKYLQEVNLSKGALVFHNPFVAVALHLFALFLSYIIPVNLKNIIVFWRIKNPLPGCRVFSALIHRDHRIDIAALESEYGGLPSEPIDENRLWYSIYKVRQNEPIVLSSHGTWLLFRDLTSISAIFLLLLPSMTFAVRTGVGAFAYLGILLLQYLVISQSARSAGNRFTCNVLVR